jgi:multicomponent Na+:H+ antiporter subunit C
MEVALAALVGVLFACAAYLLVQPDLMRMIFGLVLLNNAVNVLIFAAGRVVRGQPPLIESEHAPTALMANPLPQALLLTAIVIGFGLVTFTLVLLYRAQPTLGTLNTDALTRED